MKVETAVIMAAGRGERLWPVTATTSKPAVKFMGKSLLERIIDQIRDAGINNIYVIVNHNYDEISSLLSHMENIKLIKQNSEKWGTAAAVETVKGIVNEPFLVASGDHLLENGIYKDIVDAFNGEQMVALTSVENPSNYGVAIVKDNTIVDMEEKPEKPKSNLINMGIYVFTPEIFNEIEHVKLSKRGEYEITDVLIGKRAFISEKFFLDIGYPWNVLDAVSFLLSKAEPLNKGVIKNSRIEGNVIIEEGATVVDSVIEEPVYIGKNTTIGPFAYIRGPTMIGENCSIGGGTTVKASYIGNNVNAKHLSYIGDSVIMDNVNFGSSTQLANLRFDNETVKVETRRGLKDSGRRKLGAIVGSGTKFGVNTSVMPGKLIGKNAKIHPGVVVNRNVNDDEEFLG